MRVRHLLVMVTAALGGAALLAPAVVFPYFEDAALFAAVANYMLDGATLYRDVFDHKPPAIYLQEMVRISLFGSSALASRAVELLILLLAGLGLGASALALGPGGRRKPSSTLLFLLPTSFCAFTTSTIWTLPDRGQVEFYQAAAVAVGLSAALISVSRPDRRLPALISGVALAWAAWLKPQAALLLILFFLVLLGEGLRTNRSARRAWDLSLGATLVSAVLAVFVVTAGSFDGFYHVLATHLPAYLASLRPTPDVVMSYYPLYFLDTPRGWIVAGLATIGAVRLAWLARQRSIRWASWFLIVGTLGWGLVAYVSGGAGFRYHAVPTMVGVSVLVASGVEGLFAGVAGGPGSRWRAVTGGTLLGLISLWLITTPQFLVDTTDLWGWLSGREALASVHERRGNEGHYYSYARELEAAEVVRETVPEGRGIYVLGLAGATYLLGDRPASGRHLVTTFAYMPGYALADGVHEEVVETVEDPRTQLLLVRADDSFPWFGLPLSSFERLMQDDELLPIVQRAYEPVGRIGEYFVIFRRTSPPS